MRAAVYFIPKEEDPLYKAGTSLIGYDIRKQVLLADHKTTSALKYGFHLTLGDTLEYNDQDLGRLKTEIRECLGCFKPSTRFILQSHPDGLLQRMGEKRDVLVLKYIPNTHLIMLHTLIVARINPLARYSFFNETAASREEDEQSKIEKFKSPYILDNFEPHFTVLNPAAHLEQQDLIKIQESFNGFSEISLDSICLVTQKQVEDLWIIEHEFQII